MKQNIARTAQKRVWLAHKHANQWLLELPFGQ
jgi:hypothetical protein